MNPDIKKMQFPEYLGDSVYAGFDGYHVWLNTQNGYPDDPRNAIALEPPVLEALNRYVSKLREHFANKQKEMA
jgi:hypothetical protein